MISLSRLPYQHTDTEQVKIVVRQHPIVLCSTVLVFGVVLLLSVIMASFMDLPTLMATPLYAAIIVVGGNIYLLSLWLFFCGTIVDAYLDTWIVTNERIINIEQNGLFSRTISQNNLDRIQDITVERTGVWATLFGFGTLTVETAGDHEQMAFSVLPHADNVARDIMTLVEEHRKTKGLDPLSFHA